MDRKAFLIWGSALLTSFLVYLFLPHQYAGSQMTIVGRLQLMDLILITIPIVIAGIAANVPLRRPAHVVLLWLVPSFVSAGIGLANMASCTGGLGCLYAGMPLLAFAAFFFPAFPIFWFLRRFNINIILGFIALELVLFSFLFAGHMREMGREQERQIRQDQMLSQLSSSENISELVELCSAMDNDTDDLMFLYPETKECWTKLMRIADSKHTDPCQLPQDNSVDCLAQQRYYFNEHHCVKGKDAVGTPVPPQTLRCWQLRAKTYPNLDVCGTEYSKNEEQCREALKTSKPL